MPCRVVYDRVDCAVNCRYYGRPKRIALTLTVWVGSLICWLSLHGRCTKHVCTTSHRSSFVSCSVCKKPEAKFMLRYNRLRLRWSSGSVLAFSTQVCGFKPGRSRRIFRAKKSLNLRSTVPPFAARISRVVADGGTWRLKWERLKAGESNGKLPPRTCPGCSVPEVMPVT